MITTVFFDVGGVLLTNGWDRHCRRRVVEHRFGLDYEEFRDRHDFVAHDFEIGALSLYDYLQRTVFYRTRAFSPEEFYAAMQAQSQELPGTRDVIRQLQASSIQLATLNNESRALNEYRIEHFDLRNHFSLFLSSCYLGVKKPEPQIFRLAFQITQRSPEECLFVDDRALNLECARDEHLDGVLFEDAGSLRAALVEKGALA